MKTLCAWCLKEKGIEPSPEDSHGICRYHELKELIDAGLHTHDNLAEFVRITR